MRDEGGKVELEIAGIAATQHGNVTRRQLLQVGVSAAGIQRRVGKGLQFVEY